MGLRKRLSSKKNLSAIKFQDSIDMSLDSLVVPREDRAD
jgi:hypothetical protein